MSLNNDSYPPTYSINYPPNIGYLPQDDRMGPMQEQWLPPGGLGAGNRWMDGRVSNGGCAASYPALTSSPYMPCNVSFTKLDTCSQTHKSFLENVSRSHTCILNPD
jgi:hypothetical protein